MSAIVPPSVLGATTANIQNNTTAPPTKTQQAKLKKQQAAEKKERARELAQQQKQKRKNSAVSMKSSESTVLSEKTPFAIATDNSVGSNETNEALGDATTSTKSGSLQSTKSFALAPDEEDMSPRAKKIRKSQQKKHLEALGVGVVVTDEVADVRKRKSVKKGRQSLTEKDKVKRNATNPVAQLILKHKNQSVALNYAADRLIQEQNIRKAQSPRQHVNKRPARPVDPAAERTLALTKAALDSDNDGQSNSQDDASDRVMTVASSGSDCDEASELVVAESEPVRDEILASLPGENDFSNASSEFDEHPDEELKLIREAAHTSMTPLAHSRIQVVAQTPIYDDEVAMTGSFNGFSEGDYGDSSPPRTPLYGIAKIIDVQPEPEDVKSERFQDVTGDSTTPSVEDIVDITTEDTGEPIPEDALPLPTDDEPPSDQPTNLGELPEPGVDPGSQDETCEQGVVANATIASSIDQDNDQLAEDATFAQVDGVSSVVQVRDIAFALEDGTDDVSEREEIRESQKAASKESVVQATKTPSWVSGLLSLPNAAQFKPALSVDQELALIAAHVTPLSLPVVKQPLFQAEKELSKITEQPEAVEVVDTTPAASSEGVDMVLVEDHIAAEAPDHDQEPVVVIEVPRPTPFGILLLPNGVGLSAAEREMHEKLVAIHVTPLQLPVSMKANKGSKMPEVGEIPAASLVGDHTIPLLAANDSASVELVAHVEVAATAKEPVPFHEPAITITPLDEISKLELNATSSSDNNSDASNNRALHSPPTPTSFKDSSRLFSTRSNQPRKINMDYKAHKARNLYISTVSLEDFINALEFDQSDGSTTKTDVCEAFVALAALDYKAMTGNRPTETLANVVTSRLAQHRTKLGSTTLHTFLCAIHFDNEGFTNVKYVGQAFKEAAKQAREPSSKVVSFLRLEALEESE